MAVASAIITVIAQQEAIAGIDRIYITTRISNAVVSYCVYIIQAFWPESLTVFYPYPQHLFLVKAVVCVLLLTAITVAVVRIDSSQKKYLATGWFWFIVTLVPVIGIVQVGSQAHADRYTYIPFVGIFIMVSWGLNTIFDRIKNGKKLMVKTVSVAVILVMTSITREQIGYWENDFTLFSHALAVTKNNYIAYNNLGFFFERADRTSEAMAYYQKALNINPTYGDAHYNLGNMLFQMGRADEAIAQYRRALEINPNKINTLSNLAGALVQIKQFADAIPLIKKALTLAKSAGDESQVRELAGNLRVLNQAIDVSVRSTH